jgi:cysteinyl-tRNA synthetase
LTLRLYDTLTRSVSEFSPINSGHVGIYVCGATVQGSPHIGHLRSGVVFDVLRRWLENSNLQVTLVRNVTDIDDKILHNAHHEDMQWWALAYKYEQEFSLAHKTLGNLPPTVEPRATGHITQMIEIIEKLIEKNYAYQSQGTVWFSVRSWAEYGKLSGQKLDEMLAAEDKDQGKKDPHDFALWKNAKVDEPHWMTPWGPGRPGWHIECSAMAREYLGDEFDIHGGGIDLQFPHHENEIAQSNAAGYKFARRWMHNAWVTQAGEKMSKSLGNSTKINEVLKLVKPIHLRYYLISGHYRSNLEYSENALKEAASSFGRIEKFLQNAPSVSPSQVASDFETAMNEDLNTPKAIAVIHELVTEGNQALADADLVKAEKTAASVRKMLQILGLDPQADNWNQNSSDDRAENSLAILIQRMLDTRAQARANKDFATSDRVRDDLKQANILIEDTVNGARWTFMEEDK